MTEKTVVEGEENIGEFPVMVGGQGPSNVCFSRTRTCVGARRWALTEPERRRLTKPERLHCRLRVTEPSDRSMAIN